MKKLELVETLYCQRCESRKGRPLHTCPYQEDINDDKETLCNCCEQCEDMCAVETLCNCCEQCEDMCADDI